MDIMAEAHRRARYEHSLQVCTAYGVLSPARIGLGDVASWRHAAACILIATKGVPASGVDSYAAILANELRYIHHRNRRQRRAA